MNGPKFTMLVECPGENSLIQQIPFEHPPVARQSARMWVDGL